MSASGTSAGPGKGAARMDTSIVALRRPRVKRTGDGALAMIPEGAAE